MNMPRASILVLLGMLSAELSQADPLAIGKVTANAQRTAQYEKLELSVDLGASYQNPFDADEVRLDAVFVSPAGKQYTVPGFFMADYRREVRDGSEAMLPQGGGAWKVRFAPRETGRYTWRLWLQDRSGRISGGSGAFHAVPGDSPGFVRISPADPHYFAFDNGKGCFLIGHNLPIYHARDQTGDAAMRKFAAAKENYNRWWLSASNFGIEWTDRLGWYRQDAAARLDHVLELGKQLGQYYMLCMDTHQDFREEGWEKNPFNARNGGPCATPADWFRNETARHYYKKRLRYIVARWGYSAHVLCWELGNEFEGWADTPQHLQLAWHKEMADHLRALDPFGHLITTSFWTDTGPEEFWRLENIDIVQTHCYTNDDGNVAEPVRRYGLHQWQRFNKPHVFAEFGIRSQPGAADKDPQGWAIHNALWAGLLSFCAGGPMPWWHEEYLDKLNLYFHFTALANFTADLPLGTARWERLPTTLPQFADTGRRPRTGDVVIVPVRRWGKAQDPEFFVQGDGTIRDGQIPQQLLQGVWHKDLRNPPTFVVNYPQPGKFIVHVAEVSEGGLLRIRIDGRQRLEKAFPCGKGLGKESRWRSEWKLWETVYDEDLSVDVSPGPHRIRIDNLGNDWVKTSRYTFTGCRLLDLPDALVCGMKTDKVALLWVQNRQSCWYNHAGHGKVGQVAPMTLTVEGLRNGNCRVEWWETWKGTLQRRDDMRVSNGSLRLSIPRLETDVAIKIKRLE